MGHALHRLFFALRPPAAIALAIEQVAARFAAAGDVAGNWLKREKYHITLHFLGTYEGFPADVHQRAAMAVDALDASAQDIELDRIATFQREHSPPWVLRCSPRAERALQELARDIRDALSAAGLEFREEHAYTPHVTIGYGDRALAAPIAVEPLMWRARAFVLMDSHVGTGRHEELARWPLVS